MADSLVKLIGAELDVDETLFTTMQNVTASFAEFSADLVIHLRESKVPEEDIVRILKDVTLIKNCINVNCAMKCVSPVEKAKPKHDDIDKSVANFMQRLTELNVVNKDVATLISSVSTDATLATLIHS